MNPPLSLQGCPQPYRYLAVLDFEATCDDSQGFGPQEIIELPIVLLDTSTGAVVRALLSDQCTPLGRRGTASQSAFPASCTRMGPASTAKNKIEGVFFMVSR
jgi:hypothetical protein